ncbi:MAG: hypothetical protein PHC36_07265 [Eubacteriales bacterium]|jgi:hypothetical protein|nr:hypothetical protein [Eubacteriales bacterium]MDD4445595.1 hypothetical protein [Eubacteriales bacterium]HPF19224.1 hypothetical protein [Bacillota bacterium]
MRLVKQEERHDRYKKQATDFFNETRVDHPDYTRGPIDVGEVVGPKGFYVVTDDFDVSWNNALQTIVIDTDSSYTAD